MFKEMIDDLVPGGMLGFLLILIGLGVLAFFALPVIVAAMVALVGHQILTVLSYRLSVWIGTPLRKLCRLSRELKTLAALSALLSFIAMIAFPLLVFVGMLWDRYGNEAPSFFLQAVVATAVAWPLGRVLMVFFSGKPGALLGHRGTANSDHHVQRLGPLQFEMRSASRTGMTFQHHDPQGRLISGWEEEEVMTWEGGEDPHIVRRQRVLEPDPDAGSTQPPQIEEGEEDTEE